MAREIDHDRNFKELISTFFMEFLELFLPELAEMVDPDSVIFLQQQYFTDVLAGEEKIIDLLAEVKMAGEDATFLIHIEPQSTSRSEFPKRMFFTLLCCISNTIRTSIRSRFFPTMNPPKPQRIPTKSIFRI